MPNALSLGSLLCSFWKSRWTRARTSEFKVSDFTRLLLTVLTVLTRLVATLPQLAKSEPQCGVPRKHMPATLLKMSCRYVSALFLEKSIASSVTRPPKLCAMKTIGLPSVSEPFLRWASAFTRFPACSPIRFCELIAQK